MERVEIERMKNIDVHTVKACDLVNIEEIDINTELPKEERLLEFIKKVKNPFCYICNGMIIKTSYSDTKETLENRLVQLCVAMEGN